MEVEKKSSKRIVLAAEGFGGVKKNLTWAEGHIKKNPPGGRRGVRGTGGDNLGKNSSSKSFFLD